jgi:CubicO group peptidase (beta-lactamase class C family)
MTSRLDALRATLEATAAAYRLPGMVLAVARGEGPIESIAVGRDARGRPLAADSLVPIASITKLATALAVLRLADAGLLSVDDALSAYLPEAAAARPGVTLRRLLSHTAGLPADFAPGALAYDRSLSWPKLAAACLHLEPIAGPGVRVGYSNIGYALAASVVERVTDRPFPAALAELVLEPLGIEGYLGSEPPREVCAIGGQQSEHVGTDLEPYNSAFWRSLALPYGQMVATMDAALALVRAFAGLPDGFLRAQTRAEATRDQVGEVGGGFWPPLIWPRCPWGLGVELRGDKRPHWTPTTQSAGSFGHAGASGCVAWVDKAAGVSWAVHGLCSIETGWALDGLPRVGEAVLA